MKATPSKATQDLLQKHRKQLALYQDLDAGNKKLGQVLFSSGIRSGSLGCNQQDQTFANILSPGSSRAICPGFNCGDNHGRLDWALIEVPEAKVAINMAPSSSAIRPTAYNYRCGDSFPITQIADVKPRAWVCKTGRTTQATSGWMYPNNHPLNCHWVDEFPVNGTVYRYETWTKDWQITPPNIMRYFSQAGDSGSVVCDRTAPWWACSTAPCRGAGAPSA